MDINTVFSVAAPIDEVWKTLMGFKRAAGCVPGAQVLNKLSDDAYQVGMKVKLGPVTVQYRGQITVLKRDATAHPTVFEGRAQETRGQTHGTVSAEVALSGKVAAMGRTIIGSVTDQMMALFAENLQATVTGPAPESVVAQAARTETAAESATAALTATTTMTALAPHASQSAAESSLNALDLAKGIVLDQLSSLPKLLGTLAAVAFGAYRIGRRAGGRSAG